MGPRCRVEVGFERLLELEVRKLSGLRNAESGAIDRNVVHLLFVLVHIKVSGMLK